ncbi:unnamed protein product [Psylliodes chrysocephalus]|uniref:Uncharacterized protein n=1 Tax=Psylliodes chrysocephalus TaxID=3402493 RepID=A0A9P0GHR1_9CUCU|nr:unnamed protein product [Psylliodes chrysocephala]
MTYLNRKLRVFLEVKDKTSLSLVRSEGRLKSYSSTLDTRAWCQIVEDRRQSFLEYQARCRTGKCPEGAILPTEVKIQILLDCKNKRIKKLEKKIEYFEELIKICDALLTAEQMEKMNQEKEALAAKYGLSGEGEVCIGPCIKGTQTYGGYFDLCDDECTCLAEELLCGLLNCIAIKEKSAKPSDKSAVETSSKEASSKEVSTDVSLKPCICNEEGTEENSTVESPISEDGTVSKSTEQSSQSCKCSNDEFGGTSTSEHDTSDEPSSHISSQERGDQDCQCHKYKMDPRSTYICRGPCACG